jgi:ribosome-associated heat shock protein Hsp15
MHDDSPAADHRLDKWLWAARFFKTRGLASEAVKGGKVEINGQKAKPAKTVRVNDELRIKRGPYEYVVTVLKLSGQRGPASVAATLYQESEESTSRREALCQELKAQGWAAAQPPQRPEKRDRRRIIRFTRRHEV